MIFFSEKSLAKRSPLFRYVHYVISSVQFISYSKWKARGEPNPFVTKTYRHKGTRQSDFVDVFKDFRGTPSQGFS